MKVKQIVIVLLAATLAVSSGWLYAQETGKEKAKEGIKAEGKGGIQDFLASFWSKVVRAGKKGPSTVPTTAVAGLRGAEQEKGKELTPYWKGKEKSKDGAAMANAEALINKKDFDAAADVLKSFGQAYPDSPLKPVAVLSLAYCYAQAGKKDEAKATFESFLKDYPDHELAADARAGIELLKKENK